MVGIGDRKVHERIAERQNHRANDRSSKACKHDQLCLPHVPCSGNNCCIHQRKQCRCTAAEQISRLQSCHYSSRQTVDRQSNGKRSRSRAHRALSKQLRQQRKDQNRAKNLRHNARKQLHRRSGQNNEKQDADSHAAKGDRLRPIPYAIVAFQTVHVCSHRFPQIWSGTFIRHSSDIFRLCIPYLSRCF